MAVLIKERERCSWIPWDVPIEYQNKEMPYLFVCDDMRKALSVGRCASVAYLTFDDHPVVRGMELDDKGNRYKRQCNKLKRQHNSMYRASLKMLFPCTTCDTDNLL